MRSERATRHDLAIAFKGDTLAHKAERRHQAGAGQLRIELAVFAV